IGDEVAEAIDPQDLAFNAALTDYWPRNVEAVHASGIAPEGGELDALGQPCGGRRKAVASFERPTDRWPRIAALGEFDHAFGGMVVKHQCEDAVVWRDKLVLARISGDPAARRPDAGIDHGDKDRPNREIAIRRRQFEGTGKHIVRRNIVRDVDQRRIRADTEN